MPQYFTGSDLYNDLFLNNNREMYIKMLLIDSSEPEITEFFIRDVDIHATNGATQMLTLYSSNIYNGDILNLNAIDLDVVYKTKVSWGASSSYIITNKTFTGTAGKTFATINNNAEIAEGMSVTCAGLFSGENTIKEVFGTTIFFNNPLTLTATNATSSIATGLTYAYLQMNRFFTDKINTYNQTKKTSGMWTITGAGNGGTYYKANNFNKIIVAQKEIQGAVESGSLKVDGNSPIRRTIDFNCIVKKDFADSTDLKLRDFDNKKIKILIGIKNSTITEYDYAQYFADNGTQKDQSDIVWFKLGVFIPRNIVIKHSKDSYIVSVTAQDKMSTMDGSFGGLLGVGLDFKDPEVKTNTSFYDTILDSAIKYGKEKESKINIKLADDYSIFKYPATGFTYITSGSTLIRVKNASGLFVGMEIQAPGVYEGTKISSISIGSTFASIRMDYPAYDNITDTQFIYSNDAQILNGVTFKTPSYKNYFAIEPLKTIEPSSTLFLKPTTINLKGSTYTYGASGNIFTTISDWSPRTWGNRIVGQEKPYYTGPFEQTEIIITKQDPNDNTFTSTAKLSVGDIIYTQASVGQLSALSPHTMYKVSSIPSFNKFTLTLSQSSGDVVITIPGTSSVQDSISALKFQLIYESFIAEDKKIKSTTYNKEKGRFYVSTAYYFDPLDPEGILGYLISQYDDFNNTSSVKTFYFNILTNLDEYIEAPLTAIASKQNNIYVAENNAKAILGFSLSDSAPSYNSMIAFPIRNTYATPDTFTIDLMFIAPTFSTGSTFFITMNDGAHPNLLKTGYVISEILYLDPAGDYAQVKLNYADTGLPVSTGGFVGSHVSAIGHFVQNYIQSLTGNVLSLHITKNNELLVSSTAENLRRYSLSENLGSNLVLKGSAPMTRNFTAITSDASSNVYGVLEDSGIILKLNSRLTERLKSVNLSQFWSSLISQTNILSYPKIESLSFDDYQNLFAITGGTYSYGSIASPQYSNINKNIVLINKDSLLPEVYTKFFDPLVDYKYSLVSPNDLLFYPKNRAPNITLNQLPLVVANSLTDAISLKEFSPQTSNTIQKSGSDSVVSIFEDVKSQLGSFQYYYDFDGNFIFKEDKRLSFSDPTYSKTSPYDFNFENYSVNVDDLSIAFDFIKNSDLVSDFTSTVDLSTFKNDFFIHGTKKGLDLADENKNVLMLYHIIIDDLSIKNKPSGYLHPWQQYIIDGGLNGGTYSNFIYYNEIKNNFPFVPSREYFANPNTKYVTGEFVLVKNALSGSSSSSSYSIYEVLTGGTPTSSIYPFRKDGTIEYLNEEAAPGTGLSVRYFSSAFGFDYEKYQGIYLKISDGEAYPDQKTAIREGSVIMYPSNGKKWLYKINSIYYYDSATGTKVVYDSDRPISIKLSALELSDTFVGKTYIKQLDEGTSAELGGPSSCYIEIVNINIFNTGFLGIFRKDNSGIISNDFQAEYREGDPTSWTYYFDVVNIAGKYVQDPQTLKNIPVGITYWQPSTFYPLNSFIYSDDKIYEAIIGGTSGTTAPAGFGNTYGLIKDASVPYSNLTWKISQISSDLTKMSVSAIGSRKSATFDKDINTLFAPKEALSFFKTEGYYFIVLNDFLDYDSYPQSFHSRLEALIRQFSYLYPNIKLVFVPESQIRKIFETDKLTSLKDAFSVLKRNFYLNFVGGQSVNISAVPSYNLEPLGIIKLKDEQSDLYGNYVLTDYVLPLSNEGLITINAVKTHPYEEKVSNIPDWVLKLGKYSTMGSSYAYDNLTTTSDRIYQ